MSSDLLLRSIIQTVEKVKAAESDLAARVTFINELRRIVHYDQAVLWTSGKHDPSAISSVTESESKTPHAEQLKLLHRKQLANLAEIRIVEADQLTAVSLYHEKSALWIPLNSQSDGLLLTSAAGGFSEAQGVIAELLGKACFEYFEAGKRKPIRGTGSRSKGRIKSLVVVSLMAGAVLLSHTYVIPRTVLGPAEIVSGDIKPVKAPADAVVESVLVSPGERIEVGQPLVKLDSNRIDAQLSIANAELTKLRVEYEQELVRSFDQDASRARAADARGRISEKIEQIRFLEEEMTKYVIRSQHSGVLILAELDALIGKPVRAGELLMEVANDQLLEAEAWMNVQAALPLETGDEVKLFMHANPFSPVSGVVAYSNIRATARPDGTFGYPVRVHLTENADALVLGEQGTARLQHGETTVLKWITRRPLLWLRSTLGL